MISKEDIKKLADLARIEVGEGEMESLSGDMDSILDYVKSIQDFQSGEADSDATNLGGSKSGTPINVLREDSNPTESGTYSKELIAEFPHKEGDYLKVKKIL